MLRSASDSVPVWRARASVSACSGFSSSVTVLPTTAFWPSFSFGAWSIASTRTLVRMISELTTSATVLVGTLLALGKDHVDAVVRQDEAAGAGLRRNFGGDGAHAGGQDRRHEAGSVGPDQLLLADRLAGDEGRARDRARHLRGGVGAFAAANKGVAGRRGRPGLPLQVVGLERLAEADVGLGDENVDRRQLGDRLGGGGALSDPLARYAATPPAPTAIVSTTMRAVFIRFTFHITRRRFRRRDGS